MKQPLLQLEAVSFFRGKRAILQDITLSVSVGELAAIVGPNGAGKSTLLSLMTGGLRASHGAVVFEEVPVRLWRPGELALRRAVLMQKTEIAFPYTVDETLRLSVPELADKTSLRRLCIESLHQVGLDGFGNRLLHELSGGEQQRVHLARVLVQLRSSKNGSAQMLFLDEPVAGLDLKHQIMTMQLARELVGEQLAVVAVVHDMNLALQFATRAICLNEGRLVGDGLPSMLLTADLLADVFNIPMAVFRSADGAELLSPLIPLR